MIIGISGRIGSGKDTVGKIIQYLTYPYDIDIQTYLNKEVNGQFEIKPNMHSVPNFEIKKFAGKLKQIGSILSGIVADQFEDQEFKKLYMGVDWDMTYREFLQKLGTEAMREGLHTNVWVNALFADYKPFGKTFKDVSPVTGVVTFDTVGIHPNWIITDMRFPNEMEAVVEKGGITIRVVRDNWKPNAGDTILIKVFSNWSTVTYTHTDIEGNHFGVGTDGYKYKSSQIKQSNLHPSETALDDAKFDYEIINDGTMEELVEKVKDILVKEGLI